MSDIWYFYMMMVGAGAVLGFVFAILFRLVKW